MKRILAFFVASVAAVLSASATNRVTTVRVAFSDAAGYFVGVSSESPKGIVPEWISRMAEARGWNVEWVDVPYSEAPKAVALGEVDIAGGVSLHNEHSDGLLYAHQPMGTRNMALYALRDSPFTYGDLRGLDGCVIGVQKGHSRVDRMSALLEKHGARC